ncbi:MAG: RNA 2'-phosphotransferase [Pelagimonas sp.]
MTPAEEKHLSRFLSLVLRHDPTAADITLDAAGWVLIEDLIQGATRIGNRSGSQKTVFG